MNFLKQSVFICFLMALFFKADISLAQGTSNKGTDFWLGYGKHVSTGSMVLYLTSDVNTTATVSIPNLNFNQTVTITANSVSFVDIPTSAHLENDGISDNGIHVTSLKPIIVYAHIYQTSVSGATLVLPVNTLGKDYYSINYKQISNAAASVSWFFVVAVEDDTQVEITPSQNTKGGWAANTTHIISLKKGQIYNVLANFTNASGGSYGDDLTGSRIKSVSSNGICKKIAVFSGSSKISINCLSYNYPGGAAPGSADNLFQQVYPTSSWGKNFITVPQKDRNFVIYRIIKSDPSAIVQLNGAVIPATSFVNNFYYEFASQQVDQITSDKPIQAVQYAVTQGKSLTCASISGDVGDPEMIYLNPIEQTLTQITMYSTPRFSITKHFINVVIKNEGIASFKLDGQNVSSSFMVVPNNALYSYAQLVVAAGTHNLSSDVGFNAIAYGFGNNDSYGYAAGANLASFGIDPIIGGSNSISVATGCLGVEYDLILKLPYKAMDIQLDNGDGTGLKYITVNKKSEITKDGVTTYSYLLIPKISYNKEGTYSYKVRTTKPTIDDCGTGDEFTFDFIINSKPVAAFTSPENTCLGDASSFSYTPNAAQNINEYLWDFNGEGTANTINPKFTFNKAEVKKIKLSVKSTDGCWSDIVEKNLEVKALPVANFDVAYTCLNNSIQFTDKSIAPTQTINKWQWNFGDATSTTNISTLQNPVHTYDKLGTYIVTLIVTTDLGCTKTTTKSITIYPLPVVDFDTPDICLDDASALFTNKSTISDAVALTYLWNFGDANSTIANNTSIQKNPTHKYTEAKVYDVTLTVTSANGCVTTVTKAFTVNGSTPKSKLEVQNANALCSDQIVSFKDLATVDFGEITRIDWYYDDATPNVVVTDNDPAKRGQTAKIYTHQYPTFFSPATRAVNVKMVTYSGNSAICQNTLTSLITLKAIPKIDFSLPGSCLLNGDAFFTNLSTFVGQKTGLTYLWNFGDNANPNNSSTLENPTHHYSSVGTYVITLEVTASNGCSATLTKQFTVSGALANPDFSILNENDLCSNNKVIFSELSTLNFGEITKLEWFFDVDNQGNNPQYQLIDNSPALRSSATRSYEFTYPIFNSPITKTVIVKLKVYSGNNNCISEISKTVTLKAVPLVVFSAIPPVCEEIAPYKISQAKENSGFVGTGIFTGNGINSSGLFSPAVAGVGTHSITYTFTGTNGCMDKKSQNIVVYPTPSADAGSDFTILIGGNTQLNATASGSGLSYKWTPSTGLDKDNILNPTAAPIIDTKYTLLVTSENGCIISDDVFIKVLKYPEIPNTFTPNGDGVNDTWDIKYLSSYPSSDIKIFNRYGKVVFATTKYITPWDGKANNQDLPVGVYYYIITAKDGELKYKGSVTIIR